MRLIGVVCVSVLMIFSFGSMAQDGFKSEDELKAKALELFDNQELVKAEPLYAQLLSLYPKDPEYNYKYGACLLAASADKEKALKYLQFASSKSGVDPLAYYYLGRVHHLNYNFAKAVKAYSKFKNKASSDDQDKYQVVRQIEMCKNGNDLLSRLNEVQVIDKQEISEKDFFRIYDLKGIDGKIISKPDDFKSKYDKKIGESSIIYLPNNAKEVYYSSYGKKGENKRDIYRVVKLGNDSWSDPVKLGPSINTPYDENYAFIHPDGRTLYFASKGHSSMGGYDLFQSTYDNSINDWTAPVNLDFAFSSVDDDVLFITDEDKAFAFFASNRSNAEGKFTVYKVKVDKAPAAISVIQGSFIAENNSSLKKAKITVIDQATNQTVGVYETDEAGNYQVEINDNGGTYKFNIETTASAPIHTGIVNVPKQSEFEVLGQELRLVGSGNDQQLVIKNIFDGTASPRNASGPLISSEFLRKKASLEINLNAGELLALEAESAKKVTQAKEPSKTNSQAEQLSQQQPEASSSSDNSKSGESNAELLALESAAAKEAAAKAEATGTESSEANSQAAQLNQQESEASSSGTNLKSGESSAENSDKPSGSEAAAIAASGTASQGASAELLKAELAPLKETTQLESGKNKMASESAYREATEKSQEAKRKFQELENLKGEAQADEVAIAALEEEAGKLALQAAYSLKFAQELESNYQDKENKLQRISDIEAAVADNKLADSELKTTSLKRDLEGDYSLEQVIEKNKKQVQEELSLVASSLSSLTAKNESFDLEANKLTEQITQLEKDLNSADAERKAEIEGLLSGYRLDQQDMQFQIDRVQKQQENSIMQKEALQVKLVQLETLEGQWSSQDASAAAVSPAEKERLLSEIKEFRDAGMLAYDSEDLNLSGGSLMLSSASSSSSALASSAKNQGATTGKSSSEINSYYENQLAENQGLQDPDMQKAKKIESYTNWLKELEQRKLELQNQSGNENAPDRVAEENKINTQIVTIEEEKSKLINDLSASSANLADAPSLDAKQQNNSIEADAAAAGSGQEQIKAAPPIAKPNPAAYSSSESVGKVDVSSVDEKSIIPENYTSLDINQEFIYTNPQVVGSLSAAKKAFAAAATYGKKAENARAAAFTLSTIEERNQAFDKALEFEAASQTKQIEAAQLLGETNAKEYQKNYSQFENATAYSDEFESSNLDIATLLTEEASVYYNKALEERAKIDPNSRLALQETNLQKAYDYEMLALKKQKQALVLLSIVDTEFQANPRGAVFEVSDVTETPVAQIISDAEVMNINDASIAQSKGDSVRNLAASKQAEIQNMEAQLASMAEGEEKSALVQTLESLKTEASQLSKLAESYYQRSEQLEGTAAPAAEAVVLIKPAVVSSTFQQVDLDTVVVSESRRALVVNSKAYQDYLAQAAKREKSLKSAEVDYKLALSYEEERQQLIKEAEVTRSQAKLETDPEEKQRLIKSASVIDQKIVELKNNIDSLNTIIKVNNLMAKTSESAMDEALKNLSATERLEIIKIAQESSGSSPILADAASESGAIPSAGQSNQAAGTSDLNAAVQQENAGSEKLENQAKAATADNNTLEAAPRRELNITTIDRIPKRVESAIFLKLPSSESAYNRSKPIPVNPVMPEGLVYKVQVGAFRNPIPQDLFKGFAPLMAEKIPSGITRYTAGIFVNEKEALGARNEIRSIGYPDAFVVAFLNGKRISISQARQTDQSAAGLADADIPGAAAKTAESASRAVELVQGGSETGLPSSFTSSNTLPVKNAASIEGLYFTVQVGVFSKAVSGNQFEGYNDITVLVLDNGTIRYNVGQFDNAVEANEMKNTISTRIKDAFVTAYYNGKRISLGEAARISNQN